MNPTLNNVLEAALQLTPDQRAELVRMLSRPPNRVKEPGRLKKYFGMVDSGDPDSANNEKIDADLARSYMDNHEPEN